MTPPTLIIKSKTPGIIRGLGMTDPHFTDKNPPAYKIEYMDMLETAIASALRYAEKQQVDFVIWGGDLFHRKSPAQNTHSLVARVTRIMRQCGETASVNAGILGNHDYPFGTIERGLPGQPAEMLLETKTYHLLDEKAPPNGKGELLNIPHGDILIDAGTHSLRISGNSYHHARAEPVRDRKRYGATRLLSVGHFWFGKQSGEFFGEPVFGPDMLEKSEVDTYFIGHHHEDQGFQEVNGRMYVSPGSITRTGAHKHDRERRPSAAFFEYTPEEQKVTILRPKMPAAEDAMDLDVVDAQKAEAEELDHLTQVLAAAESKSTDPKAILDEISPAAEVKKAALEYLQRAEQEA